MDPDQIWDELETALPPMYEDFRGRLNSLLVERKQDRTLLSEADVAIQERIVSVIGKTDPRAQFVAEEAGTGRPTQVSVDGSDIWIIDPIDGTREFLSPTGKEFCSVVCQLRDLVPVGAFVLAPELARGANPLSIRVSVDGFSAKIYGDDTRTRGPKQLERANGFASVTRSSSDPGRAWEQALLNAGYRLKLRTTSQTLDMVRTCIDVSACTEDSLPSFDLFYRESQKVWDGAAGLCLARALGRASVDRHGRSLLPIPASVLEAEEPTFESSLIGSPDVVEWFLSEIVGTG